MQLTVEYITPQVASEYLQRNTMNRPINSGHLRHLCRQMRDGLWKGNGDSIRFAKTGELLDGQHRLLAICQTGTTQEMVVIRNLEREVFNTIDSGSKRSAGNVLCLSGYKNSNDLAAICRMILMKRKIGHPTLQGQAGSYSPTSAEILDLVKADQKVVDAGEFSVSSGFLKSHMPTSSIGFLHYSASMIGQRECVEDFFANVKEVTAESINTPAHVFRERLIQNKGAREKMLKYDLLAMAFRAYKHFRDGKIIKILKPVADAGKRGSEAFDL